MRVIVLVIILMISFSGLVQTKIDSIKIYTLNFQLDTRYGYGINDVTIAQKISTFLSDKNENSLEVAGDGYGVFSGGDNKFIGFRQSVSKEVINNKKGGFVTIKDGKKIYKKQHAYTGASTPKKGDKKKYE
ncbi:MAG: hypothetical protein K9G36_08010 [Crocinitomicaceae bacterium]|jgi:hypothetical protein|nr:hypothetical protein [Crocinitomicaceae bacterium]